MSDKKLQEENLSNNPESEQKVQVTPETTEEQVAVVTGEESEETPEKTSTENLEETTEDKSEETTEEKTKEPPVVSKTEEEKHEDEEEEIASSDDHHKEEEHEEEENKDYHSLSKKQLIVELESLLKSKPVQQIKQDVEEIRSEFNAKFNEELEHQKEEFLAGGGNIIDFHYTTPVKKAFNSLFFDYKEKRNAYYKNLKKDLHANLEIRQALIDELKGLLNAEENINTTYKHFKDIQERWHTAGPIPRDKYNLIWNTYRHHVENFYDFLHLNREFRDLDFKHNLEQKIKLITRAEELQQEENISKAFRELQMLHKMWKEDVGPVAKEYRDDVWEKFSAATKIIHDRRFHYLKEMESAFEDNLVAKQKIVSEIAEVRANTKPSHQNWQKAIKKVQELRDQYFEIGKVPRADNKEIWNSFKEATRAFNKEKNNFYKNQKKEQYTNLEKKRELIKIAEENKDSEDFEVVTPLMKKIQADWKKIGHVPRKDSDKIWKEFKDACNYYFDRLHSLKDEANKEENVHFETKTKLLEEVKKLKLSGKKDDDLSLIKEKINEWKKIGRVPFRKKSIEQQFNKALDSLFSKLDMNKNEAEMIKFENKLNTMVSQEDERKLKNEHFFISKKIDEAKNEIRQLENNLGFFQHVDESNPLVKEVHQNIARHKEQLEVWKAKLKRIKKARNS
ncbi:MAG: DUF349 domain-containing protein [Bacteroidia bacterium]|nr:DUF349 domain-containing protein [Bacteroidia bacterium]NNF30167.1 DUF349 domain-containing protein [Flavobacteriaceae bacterium]MBT8275045.1 DUF349 domain-containing protein [Bacteroidia bacterium]NNJ82838.1 DUF349 domain-containing protein [Flavobacteriaceae bacterium]NNK55469.1 DUF349 domain-containing protein [Flavobacteriaceae bacterium]